MHNTNKSFVVSKFDSGVPSLAACERKDGGSRKTL